MPVIEEKYDPDRAIVRISVDPEPAQKWTKDGLDAAGNHVSDPKLTQKQTKTDPEIIRNLSASTRQVYLSLRENPDMTLRGLSSKLGFSKSTVTTAIGTLVTLGLLCRVGPKKGGHWEIKVL